MKDKTLATFRIEPEQWEAFKEMAANKGTNASAVLNELVSWYLAGNDVNTSSDHLDRDIDNIANEIDKRIDEKLGDIDERIYKRLEEKLEAQQAQIEELRGKLKAR